MFDFAQPALRVKTSADSANQQAGPRFWGLLRPQKMQMNSSSNGNLRTKDESNNKTSLSPFAEESSIESRIWSTRKDSDAGQKNGGNALVSPLPPSGMIKVKKELEQEQV